MYTESDGREMTLEVRNPLLRTPLSLIIDDSCPVINKAWHWIRERHDWRLRNRPDSPPWGWEKHYDKLGIMPSTIPASFAAEWAQWCGDQGIRGKFSMIPYPAGVGRIDRGFPDHPASELRDWLRVARELIAPNFDLTPEMLTHTMVVDLATWKLTEAWEQEDWVDPPEELLYDYIVQAMRLLRNAGIACEGVTSPGAFGSRKEDAYSRAVLEAAMEVNGNSRPFYFLSMELDAVPTVPVRHARKREGAAVASIVGCAGDWFGATGYDESNPDRFITEDLRGGRIPAVLAAEAPCVLVGHWPCFFANHRIGFGVLKTVKRRLDAYDPDRIRTIWMKTSEIGRYWMARELSDLSVRGREVSIRTRFPAERFTFTAPLAAVGVRSGAAEWRRAVSRRDFRSGTYLVEGDRTHVALDLESGETVLELLA